MNKSYIDKNFFRQVQRQQKLEQEVVIGNYNIYDYVHDVLIEYNICNGLLDDDPVDIYVPESVTNSQRDVNEYFTVDLQFVVYLVLTLESNINVPLFSYRRLWNKRNLQELYIPSGYTRPYQNRYSLKQTIIDIAKTVVDIPSSDFASVTVSDKLIILKAKANVGCLNCSGVLTIKNNSNAGSVVFTESYTCNSSGEIDDTNKEPFSISGLPEGLYYIELNFNSCSSNLVSSTTYYHSNAIVNNQSVTTVRNNVVEIDFTQNSSICDSPVFRVDSVTNGLVNVNSNSTGIFEFTPTNNFIGTGLVNVTLVCNDYEIAKGVSVISITQEDFQVLSMSPADNSTDVGVDTRLILTYPDNLVLSDGTGTFNLATVVDPSTPVVSLTSSDADVTVSGNTVIISNIAFDSSTEYTFFIDSDFVRDSNLNQSLALPANTFSFTTGALPNVVPTASLSASSTNIELSTVLTLDASLSTDDKQVVSYLWDLDNTETFTTVDPVLEYTYGVSGAYNPSVTVYDVEGESDTATIAINVFTPITADYSRFQNGLEVQFTNTTDPGNTTITDWLWDLGDGDTSTLENPLHTYSDEGVYTVTLTANSVLDSDTVTKIISVYNAEVDPYSCISWVTQNLSISDTCDVNTNNSTINGQWNANGAYSSSLVTTSDSNVSLKFTHNSGRYSVGLCNLNDRIYYYQNSLEFGCYIAANSIYPVVNATTITPAWSISTGDEVTISKNGDIVTYAVNGVTQGSFTYNASQTPIDLFGKIAVRNIDTDFDSLLYSTSENGASNPPSSQFTFNTSNLVVNFTNTSVQGTHPINQYFWSFGDLNTSTLENPTHTYVQSDDYIVSLTVTDQLGEVNTSTQTISVSANTGPTASFNTSITNLSVLFTNISTQGSSMISGYSWNFGDGTTSTSANPSHVYSTPGTYTVTLTVTDNNSEVDIDSQNITVSTSLSDIDTIISAWSEENRDRDTGDFTSSSIQNLVANQNTNGTFPELGAIPTSSTSNSIYYLWDWLLILRKLASDYRYGTYTGTAGDTDTRNAIWRGLKGINDNIENLKFYSRGTWTPMGWWVPREFSRVLASMLDAYASYSSNTIDGVSVEEFVTSLVDDVLGATNLVKNDNFSGWHDIPMTGSIDNIRGNNQIARQSQMQGVAAFAAKHSGDTLGIDLIKSKIESNFIIGAGLVYIEEENIYSGWVGIGPNGAYAAHNDTGIQDQLGNYGRVTLRNHSDYVRRSAGTVYEHNSDIYDYIVTLCEMLAKSFIRSKNSFMSEGREGLRVLGGNNFGTFPPGAVSISMEPYLDYANLTNDQRNRIANYETSIRRPAVLPNYNSTNYMWTTGTSVFIGGVAGSEYSSRWRLGKRRNVSEGVAGISHVEQAIGATPNLFTTEGCWYGMGHDVNEDNNLDAFNQWHVMVPAYPFECPHGSTNWQNPNDSSYRLTASTLNTPSSNDLAGGCTYDNRFIISGYYKNRTITLSKVNCYSAKIGIERADNKGYVFHLESGITTKNGYTGNIITNTVDPFDRDITYNFTGTQQVRSQGNYGLNTYNNPVLPYVWYEATPSHSSYNYGKGTMWLENPAVLNVNFSTETRTNSYLRGGMGGSSTGYTVVMSKVHTNPNNSSATFVDVFRTTASDMEILRANIDDEFFITNTSEAQGVVDIVNNTAHYVVYDAAGATLPIEISNSNVISTITVDKPCALHIVKSGTDYIVTYADLDWKVQADAKLLNIEITGKTASDYPFATIELPDRGPLYPAGTYTGGGSSTVTI